MGAVHYIIHGNAIFKDERKRDDTDAYHLNEIAEFLVNCPKDAMFAAMDAVSWYETYDVANPFGDRRGASYESVWTFNLDEDTLHLVKRDRTYTKCFHYGVSLSLARQRHLAIDDFTLLDSPDAPPVPDAVLEFPGPYWEPALGSHAVRDRAFLGRILRDFGHTWRHLFRRQQNQSTFLRLSYAVVWLTTLNFSFAHRSQADRTGAFPYASATSLPEWTCPDDHVVRAGSVCFVLSQSPSEGLKTVREMVADEHSCRANNARTLYVIITLRHVILLRRRGDDDDTLETTEPLFLFDGERQLSAKAVNILLQATEASRKRDDNSSIHLLPVEIQDRIIHFTSSCSIEAAKTGCELALGSPFLWCSHDNVEIVQEEFKRKRLETSPVESQLLLGSVMCGLSYKPRHAAPEDKVLGRPETSVDWLQKRARPPSSGRLSPAPPTEPSYSLPTITSTYLDNRIIRNHVDNFDLFPDAPDIMFQRGLGRILAHMFPASEHFDVVRNGDGDLPRPDFVVVETLRPPMGLYNFYDFCMVESRASVGSGQGQSQSQSQGPEWCYVEDQCANSCDLGGEKAEGEIYAMIHVGAEVRFYKYEKGSLRGMSGKLHLKRDAREIMGWAQFMKENPFPYV